MVSTGRRHGGHVAAHRAVAPLRALLHLRQSHRTAAVREGCPPAGIPVGGSGFSGGVVDSNAPRGYNFDVNHDYFERAVWPAVAHRFPAFEAAKCHRTWSGLYEQCELDGNPILGNWPRTLENLYVCAGFSGHGMMHAPAAGRAIAEQILYGEDRSIDLARFGYERVLRNRPYAERGIV